MATVTQRNATVQPDAETFEATLFAAADVLGFDLAWECLSGNLPDPAEASVASDECVALADWIDVQAARYDALGTTLGTWLAGRLSGLASTARLTLASTPAELDEREERLVIDHENSLRDEGYDAGAITERYMSSQRWPY